MTDLYIIRHGQTEWNEQRRIQGRQNSHLTQEGINQTLHLSGQLSDISFSACYSSPMPRAIHTSHLLIGQRDIPLIVDPLLVEMDLGNWEGYIFSDFKNADSKAFDAFSNRADLFVSDGIGESFDSVVDRATKFLEQFENMPAHCGPFLCITHCILIQALSMICENRPLSTLRSSHRVHQTAPFLFRYDRKKMLWSVLKKNGS